MWIITDNAMFNVNDIRKISINRDLNRWTIETEKDVIIKEDPNQIKIYYKKIVNAIKAHEATVELE